MQTSCYKLAGHLPNAVSVAGRAPESYFGRCYRKLAPKYWIWKDYQRNHDTGLYTVRYQAEVLDKLDPAQVHAELGDGAVLLCHEAPGLFCHRRLVAGWLEQHLGIRVPEWMDPEGQM